MAGHQGRVREWLHQHRQVRQWLNPAALVFVGLAAVMGWSASFVGLHAYATTDMTGFNFWTGWFVPATFDGAAFGCTLITYRASINGRSAIRGRVLMWAFTAVSAWINWIHQTSPQAQAVAAGLPVAAVAVFEVVLLELRADHEAEHGRQSFRLRPGLLVLRWLADRAGTNVALREQITNIPVTQIAGLAATTPEQNTTSTHRTPTADDEHQEQTQPTTRDPEPSTQEIPTPGPRPAPASPPTAPGPKLPPATLTALRTARDQAQTEGREFTTADIQQVIKLPAPMAEAVLADLTAAAAA